MSESKSTPGPWNLETVKTQVGICHKIGKFPCRGDRTNYACVYDDGHIPGVDEKLPRSIELLANARLIAAAPDLLNVCLELLPMVVLHRGCECGGNLPDSLSAWAAPLAQLKAAIAKATGAAC